jgi:hypothetical protein
MGNVFKKSEKRIIMKGIVPVFSKRPQLGAYATLVIATLLVYFPALSNEFLMLWDDQWVVINSYTYHGFTADNLWRILTEFYKGQYAPFNQLYYTSLYAVFGLNAFVFHLGSLLLHLANVLFVYSLIHTVLPLSRRFNKTNGNYIAFFTALLFAIHPFNVESVAWLSASKVLVYSFFFLLALLSYVKYISSKKLKFYFLTLLLFVFSFGGKEQAVSLSLTVLLLDYVLGRNLKDKKIWFEKIPFFALSILGGIVAIHAVGRGYIEGTGYPFHQRIVYSSYALVEYFVKCVTPVKLSYLYPYPNQMGEALPLNFWIYPALVLVLLSVFVYYFRVQKHKWAYFVLLFFIVNLSVTLHIISLPRFAIVADRYVYISSIAVCLSIGMLSQYIVVRYHGLKRLFIAGLVMYVLLLGTYSNERVKVWHDVISLKKELREQVQQREDYLKRFAK